MEAIDIHTGILTPQQAQAHFDLLAPNYDFYYHHHKRDVYQVVEAAQLQPTDLVLDLGTGAGWVADQAARECALAVGLDISPQMIEKAQNDSVCDNTRFGIANMLSREAVEAATTNLVYNANTLHDLAQAGITLSQEQPPRFDVVFLCASFDHIHPDLRAEFLRMIHDHLLTSTGRLVLCHESSRGETYTIEVTYRFHYGGPFANLATYGRRRVAGEEAEEFVRNEVLTIGLNAGYLAERTVILNSGPVREGNRAVGYTYSGYQNVTQDVEYIAERLFPDVPQPGFHELEIARGRMIEAISDEFYFSAEYPHPDNGDDTQGYETRWVVRYKHATAVGVFRSQHN